MPPWAVSISLTICESAVSSPVFTALIYPNPSATVVPPITSAPGIFGAGRGSPVIMASLHESSPDRSVPSQGTDAARMSLRTSPVWMRSTDISVSTVPSDSSKDSSGNQYSRSPPFLVTRVAVLGARSMSFVRALEVDLVAAACRYFPRSTNVMSTALVSKKCAPMFGTPVDAAWIIEITPYKYDADVPMAIRESMPRTRERNDFMVPT